MTVTTTGQHRTRIPPLYTPFHAAIHPEHEDIDRQTGTWAQTLGIGDKQLRERLVSHEIGVFAARVLPEGKREVVQILADFVLWLFGVDDGLCEEGELGIRPAELTGFSARLLRIAQNPEIPVLAADPLAAGLRDLRRRMDRHATVGQIARWVDALREYFLAVIWEASYREAGSMPTLDDYTLMRIYDGATNVVPPLLEMGHGYELQPYERESTLVRATTEIANFVITWDNDILSHHKESRGGRYYVNAVRVLQHEHGLGTREALAEAVRQRDRVLCLFLRLCQHLGASASPQLRKYLESLGCYIRAAQDWEISSVRYTTPDDPADLPTTFRDTPIDGSSQPVPIPVIAWWWDLLPPAREGRPAPTPGPGSGPSTGLVD